MIATIDVNELEEMCYNDSDLICLMDKLKLTRQRVPYGLVDDLDFFTFPAKFINH